MQDSSTVGPYWRKWLEKECGEEKQLSYGNQAEEKVQWIQQYDCSGTSHKKNVTTTITLCCFATIIYSTLTKRSKENTR